MVVKNAFLKSITIKIMTTIDIDGVSRVIK